jgi:hypothetical protein
LAVGREEKRLELQTGEYFSLDYSYPDAPSSSSYEGSLQIHKTAHIQWIMTVYFFGQALSHGGHLFRIGVGIVK